MKLVKSKFKENLINLKNLKELHYYHCIGNDQRILSLDSQKFDRFITFLCFYKFFKQSNVFRFSKFEENFTFYRFSKNLVPLNH